MIYGVIGDLGSGKTLTAAKYAYLHYLQGFNIYSNIKLNFPYTEVDENFLKNIVKENTDFNGENFFLLDEFDMYIDSRSSAREQNRLISYFIKQVRKKRIKLFYCVQYEHMIDVRLRDLTFMKIICEKKVYPLDLPSGKYFEAVIITNEIYNREKMTNKFKFLGNPYYNLYNTYELVTTKE